LDYFSDIAIPFPITHIAKRRAITVINKMVPQIIKVTTIAVFTVHLLAQYVLALSYSLGGKNLGALP